MQGHIACQVKPVFMQPCPSQFPVVAAAFPGRGGAVIIIFFSRENPVKFTDPDGRTEIDFENKTIYANLDDIQDLDMANQQLAGFHNTPGYEGFTVTAIGQNGTEEIFSSFSSLTEYLENIDPTLTQEDKNRIAGSSVMLAGVVVMGLSLYGAKVAGPESKDSGPAQGFVLGLQMFSFGALQMATGEDIMGYPIQFVDELIKDPRIDIIKGVSDFNIKKK